MLDLLSSVKRPLQAEGKHAVKVKSVEGIETPTGTKGLKIVFETDNRRTISDKFYLTESAKFKLVDLTDALKWTDDEKRDGLKRTKFLNRRCFIMVEKHRNPQTYKTYFEIVGYAPDPAYDPTQSAGETEAA